MSDESWKILSRSIIIDNCPFFSAELEKLEKWSRAQIFLRNEFEGDLAAGKHQVAVNHWWNELPADERIAIIERGRSEILVEMDKLVYKIIYHDRAVKDIEKENRHWYINQPGVPT